MYKKLTRQEFLKVGGGAFVGASVMGLAGCGGGQSSSGGLSYWASQQAPTIAQDEQILGKVAKQFKKQTGIAVDVKVIGWTDLFSRITTAVSSGQGPDVLNIGNTWSPTLQATGGFLPFDQDQLNAIGGKSKFIPAAYHTSGAPGKTPTSVPVYGLSYALYYNKAMFEEAGIGIPPRPGTSLSPSPRSSPMLPSGGGWPSKGRALPKTHTGPSSSAGSRAVRSSRRAASRPSTRRR